MTATTPKALARPLIAWLALCGAVVLGGCNRTVVAEQPSYPADYRERHPITLREGERTVELFLARKRGGLTPAQRADVLAFAQTWRREATSGIVIEVPQGGATAASAAESMREVHAMFAASGVPAQAVAVRSYRAAPAALASIKISYAKLSATAGPCGRWPNDIGISVESDHNLNRPYWNFGCATQRNLAAMVENPADLVQPRGETPPSSARRAVMLDKYRLGESPSGKYENYNKGNVSDLAKQ
jgi:pilus assembly protein CpaD